MENQTLDSERRPYPQTPYPTPKQQYLIGYNALNLVFWSSVLGRAAFLVPALLAQDKVQDQYEGLFELLKWTQSLALLEIVHAAVGLVRASPVTTALQVASRLFIVWGILNVYPQIVVYQNTFGRDEPGLYGAPHAFAGLIVAWSITECIRYAFFVWKEAVSERVPAWLTWLRYNTFFVLYPLGIASECWLVYCALDPAGKGGMGYDWPLRLVLLIYVPGSYVLYTHMMAQRRKVIKGKGKMI